MSKWHPVTSHWKILAMWLVSRAHKPPYFWTCYKNLLLPVWRQHCIILCISSPQSVTKQIQDETFFMQPVLYIPIVVTTVRAKKNDGANAQFFRWALPDTVDNRWTAEVKLRISSSVSPDWLTNLAIVSLSSFTDTSSCGLSRASNTAAPMRR